MVAFDFDKLRRLVSFTATRLNEDRIPQVAGSLTFTTVLSLVPLFTVAFAIFTAFPIFGTFQASLQNFLANHLMPAQVSNQIFKYLDLFVSKAKGLTTIGLLFLVVTSVMTMMTVESAFNVIWRVRKPRPLAQRVVIYWGVITLGPILFGVSLSVSSYVLAQSLALSGMQHVPALIGWVFEAAALPLTVAAYGFLYSYLPNCRVELRDALPGAVLAGVGFELARHGFSLYIKRFPTYAAVYGAFAAVPIFLLWVYLLWFITLAGATIAALLPAIRAGQFHRQHFAGGDLLDAINALAVLDEARGRGADGYPTMALARILRCDLETAKRVLRILDKAEWIARLPRHNAPANWIMLANPRQITLNDLYERFVLDRIEFNYQIGQAPTQLNGQALRAALGGRQMDVTLADLIAPVLNEVQPEVVPQIAGHQA
jgi:membrane protein